MLALLREGRQKIEEDIQSWADWYCFSPTFYAQYQTVLPLMHHHIRGKTVDLGCGNAPFKDYLADHVSVYHTLDLWPRSDEVTYVGDVQNMDMISSDSYDSAICLEVLEHVPNPCHALGEINRILKPDGTVIISVPHLSRLHDVPYDYFRFTIYGLHHLLSESGFEVLEVQRKGGLFSFIGHQVSTLILSVAWSVPGLQQVIWFLNKWCVTQLCYRMDTLFDRNGFFALGYVGVARKLVS